MSATSFGPRLEFLSAGAAQGLVQALQARFEADGGLPLHGRFGAVGAMRELLVAGQAPCDFFISTHKMVQDLVAEGRLRPGSAAPLGRVHTGVAVREGEPDPAIGSPDELQATLVAATALYFPDPERATAGIHFAKVLGELGLVESTRSRWRTFPNGATAMREMAIGGPAGSVGCTQASEILITAGVRLVGTLPQRFDLATLYTAAIAEGANQPGPAARFIGLLTSPAQHDARERCGFTEP